MCWAQVFAEYAHVIRTTSLLGVTGKLQVQEGIVHLAEQTEPIMRRRRMR